MMRFHLETPSLDFINESETEIMIQSLDYLV